MTAAAAFFVARLLVRRGGGAEPSARRGVSRFGNAAGGDLGGEHVPAQEGQRVVARVDARARDPAREGRPRDGEGDLPMTSRKKLGDTRAEKPETPWLSRTPRPA